MHLRLKLNLFVVYTEFDLIQPEKNALLLALSDNQERLFVKFQRIFQELSLCTRQSLSL
jgi:hypothetical protein